jgi:hypothetical protein
LPDCHGFLRQWVRVGWLAEKMIAVEPDDAGFVQVGANRGHFRELPDYGILPVPDRFCGDESVDDADAGSLADSPR